MHIEPTAHEHGRSGKVYQYEGDYDVDTRAILWKAAISQGGQHRRVFSGEIPLTTPALGTLAEQAVRDDILKCIDRYDDSHGDELDGLQA